MQGHCPYLTLVMPLVFGIELDTPPPLTSSRTELDSPGFRETVPVYWIGNRCQIRQTGNKYIAVREKKYISASSEIERKFSI